MTHPVPPKHPTRITSSNAAPITNEAVAQQQLEPRVLVRVVMAPGLRLHGFVARSRANGPGIRAVVWTQGCTLGCPGCFNPGSHPSEGPGGEVATDELAALSVVLLTGYTLPEIRGRAGSEILLSLVDVLIAGRYVARLHLARGLRGSSNKRTHMLTARYTVDDLEQVPDAELIIGPDGTLTVTGVDPLMLATGEAHRRWA
jgi:anaerobic ribonucleoside-triphosphate reductase activating protein